MTSTDAGARVLAVAKKEFAEHSRRGGILVIAALFLVVVLGTLFAAAYFLRQAAQEVGAPPATDLSFVYPFFQTFMGLLVPVFAMVLAHGAIAGEVESGSFGLLLSQPVRRHEVVVGKYLGLLGVMLAAQAIGLGLGGLAVTLQLPGFRWGEYFAFVGGAMLFAAAYLGLFLLYSALVPRRNPALVLAIVTWVVLGVAWDKFAAALVAQGGVAEVVRSQGVPIWFTFLMLLSPPDLFAWFVYGLSGIASTTVIGFLTGSETLTGGFRGLDLLKNPWVTGSVLALWAIVTTAVASFFVQRKDY